MAAKSLNDLALLINQQIGNLEELNIALLKAKALLEIASQSEVLSIDRSIQHSYLWAVSDIIDSANKVSENCLSAFLKCFRH